MFTNIFQDGSSPCKLQPDDDDCNMAWSYCNQWVETGRVYTKLLNEENCKDTHVPTPLKMRSFLECSEIWSPNWFKRVNTSRLYDAVKSQTWNWPSRQRRPPQLHVIISRTVDPLIGVVIMTSLAAKHQTNRTDCIWSLISSYGVWRGVVCGQKSQFMERTEFSHLTPCCSIEMELSAIY